MKKIGLIMLIFMACIINAQAYKIKIIRGSAMVVEDFKLDGGKYYLHPFREKVDDFDVWKVNCLANIISSNSEYNGVVIQALIYEETCKDCDIQVLDDSDNVLNVERKKENIYSMLKNNDKEHALNNTTYNVEYGEKLFISSTDNLSGYKVMGYGYSFDNNTFEIIPIKTVGNKKIVFKPYLNYFGDKISSPGLTKKEFSISVNIIGSTYKFNVDREFYNLTYDVYDDHGLIERININPENNTYYSKNGKNLIFKDVFAKQDDYVILNNGSDFYEINVDLSKVYYNLVINTNLTKYLVEDKNFINNNINIYDDKNNLVTVCKDSICELSLNIGTYYIMDNDTKKYEKIYLSEDMNYVNNKYYIDGFKTNENIVHLKDSENIYDLEYNDGIYYLKDLIPLKEYDILIGDTYYKIDLNDASKYEYTKEHLLYAYVLEKDDNPSKNDKEDILEKEPIKPEIPKKEESFVKEENSKNENNALERIEEEIISNDEVEEVIEIDVPKTDIEDFKNDYWLFKKKYYYSNFVYIH